MTTPETGKAAFRIRSRNESGKMSKGYVRSYDLLDEQSQKVQARCDLIGNAALRSQEIVADDGECWTSVLLAMLKSPVVILNARDFAGEPIATLSRDIE